MTVRAAIDGDYADFKIVKTRSVAQLVVEIPIEQAAEMVRLFGIPQPGKPVRVAVARLGEPPQIEAKANGDGREHGPWPTLSPTLQSVLRCQSEAFWTFLNERMKANVHSEEEAATWVRGYCGVNSRASLKGASAKVWGNVDRSFQAWLQWPAP